MYWFRHLFFLFLIGGLLSACAVSPDPTAADRLQVVASTTIIGDVVQQVGGEKINLTVLMPVGADPHTFEPRPQDLAAISQADVLFVNGLGLEEALETTLEANLTGRLVHVPDGIQVLSIDPGDDHADDEPEGDVHAEGDPHTWMDPQNVIVWVRNIEAALSEADPKNRETYQHNASKYLQELENLDTWIRGKIETIPPEQRKLVTDHAVFGYFARQYGFEQVGLVVASLSTNAAPSAQGLAELENAIRVEGVPAIFVGKTVNPALAEQVAKDTGTKLVFIYTGSLSEPGGEADSYLNFMRYNVEAIVQALQPPK